MLALCGCYSPVGELLATHVEAGGAVAAAIDGGPMLSTEGLADGNADPMTINGFSNLIVVGIIVGDDDISATAAKPLLLKNQAVTMTVGTTSRARLSVHIDGRSCAATSAIVHLTPDGKGHIDGDFTGSGSDGCTFAGTLKGIPIEQ
jgi:hypothetical protein